MKNKTVENMELILLEIKREAMNPCGDSKAVKTLIHSYRTFLNEFYRMTKEELTSEILDDINYQSSQLSLVVDYIESVVLPKLLTSRDYIGVNNYATALEKMKGIVQETRGNDTTKKHKNHFKSDTIIEELLNLSIKSGTLITFVDETLRGTGKTTALIKKAHETKAVLIVNNSSHIRYANDLANEMGLSITVASLRETHLAQYRSQLKENGFLVDELIDDKVLTCLKEYRLVGGFKRIVI